MHEITPDIKNENNLFFTTTNALRNIPTSISIEKNQAHRLLIKKKKHLCITSDCGMPKKKKKMLFKFYVNVNHEPTHGTAQHLPNAVV